jgi:hypothetical protein
MRPTVVPTSQTTVKAVPIKDQRAASGRPLTLREKKVLIEEQKRHEHEARRLNKSQK